MSQKHNYPVTKVVMGRKIPTSQPKEVLITNADSFRASEFGLYALLRKKNDYVNSNIEYDDQHPETLSRAQIEYLTAIYQDTENYLDKNSLLNPKNKRITKALRQKNAVLERAFKSHKKQLAKIRLPPYLEASCKRLIEFVLELIEAFNFLDNLIPDINKIPNRPADRELRILVDKIICDYQHTNKTSKFPTHPYVLNALNEGRKNLPNFELSPRQYFNFKTWRKNGKYWWFIHPASRH